MEIQNRKTYKVYFITPEEWAVMKEKGLSKKFIVTNDKEYVPERRIIPIELIDEKETKKRQRKIHKIIEETDKKQEDE